VWGFLQHYYLILNYLLYNCCCDKIKKMKMDKISKKYIYKPYNKIFPELFVEEFKKINKIIGNKYKIYHMGSTAVDGLGGKGIIDIYVSVPNFELNRISKLLSKNGYEFRPDAGTKNRLFHRIDREDPVDGIRRYHIHVVDIKSTDFISSLKFRDYLRSNPKLAREYEKVKKYAASIAGESKDKYMNAKKNIIKKINTEIFFVTVSQIPVGRVATYGQLANMCGIKSPRYVGYLLHNNPDPEKVPCHRVVNSKGKLSKSYAFGGINAQRKKLNSEGVEVISDGVNLNKYLWINDK